MTEIQTDLSEEALTAAIEANLLAMLPGLFSNLPQGGFHDLPDLAWFATGIAHPLFNGVVRPQIVSGDAKTCIEGIQAYFVLERLPMLWWLGPSAQPADLGQFLKAYGLIHLQDSPGMALALDDLPDLYTPSNVTVRRVWTAEELAGWVRPVAAGFQLPDEAAALFVSLFDRLGLDGDRAWHHYIGSQNGDVVGAASLFLGAGVAGIYNVATLPRARQQGIGTILTLTALHDARKRGYHVGILHASEMGLGLYRQLGFQEYCKIAHYIYFPSRVQRLMLRVYKWLQRFKGRKDGSPPSRG